MDSEAFSKFYISDQYDIINFLESPYYDYLDQISQYNWKLYEKSILKVIPMVKDLNIIELVINKLKICFYPVF